MNEKGQAINEEVIVLSLLNIAIGSAAEVVTQLHIACNIGYINTSELEDLEAKAGQISASLKNLIKSRKKKAST